MTKDDNNMKRSGGTTGEGRGAQGVWRSALRLMAVLALGIVVACNGDDPVAVNGNGDDNDDEPTAATLQGTIQALTSGVEQFRITGSPPRSPLPNPEIAEVDSMRAGTGSASGALEGFGGNVTTEISADGSYTFPQASPGRRDVMIEALIDNELVGQVLVYSRTTLGAEINVEPITRATTMEAAIIKASASRDFVFPEDLLNTPQAGVVFRVSEENGEAVATSREEIRAAEAGYRSGQRFFVAALRDNFPDVPFDGSDIRVDHRAIAQAYADARHGGTDVETAHAAFVEETVANYLDHTGSPGVNAIAWGGFGTHMDHHLAEGNSVIRLDQARNLLRLSLETRRYLVEDLPASEEREAVVDALEAMESAGAAAGEMTAFAEGVLSAREEGIDALRSAMLENGGDAEYDAAISAADLGPAVDVEGDPRDSASGMEEYLSGVEDAVEDLASAAGVDSDVALALILALMTGPGYAGT